MVSDARDISYICDADKDHATEDYHLCYYCDPDEVGLEDWTHCRQSFCECAIEIDGYEQAANEQQTVHHSQSYIQCLPSNQHYLLTILQMAEVEGKPQESTPQQRHH